MLTALLEICLLARMNRLFRPETPAVRRPIAEIMEGTTQEHAAGDAEAEPPRTATRIAAARSRTPVLSLNISRWRGRIVIGTGSSVWTMMGQVRSRVRDGESVEAPGEIAMAAMMTITTTATTTTKTTTMITASSAGTDAGDHQATMAGVPSEWDGLSELGCHDGRVRCCGWPAEGAQNGRSSDGFLLFQLQSLPTNDTRHRRLRTGISRWSDCGMMDIINDLCGMLREHDG